MASFIGGNPQPPYTGGKYPAPVPTINAYAPPTAGNAGDADSDSYTSTSYLDYPTPTASPLNLDTAFDNFLAATRDKNEDTPPVTPTASVTPSATATASPVVYAEATPTVSVTPTVYATATASPTAYVEVTPTANSGYSERYYMATPTVASAHYGTYQAAYAHPTPTAYSSRRPNNPPQQLPPVNPPVVHQHTQPEPPVIQQPPVVHEYRQPDPPPVVHQPPPLVDNQTPPRRPKSQDVPRQQPVPQQLTPQEQLMLSSNPHPVRLPDGTIDDSQNGFNLVPPNVSASLLNPAAIQALGNPFMGSTGGSPVPHGGGGGGKNWTQDLYSGILDNYFGGQQPSSDGITETAGLQFTSGF